MTTIAAPLTGALTGAASAQLAPGRRQLLPLRLEQVSLKIDRDHLLDAVSLRIDAGTRTVVLGPNGAGKSLLLNVCHGLIEPTAGRVCWAVAERQTIRRDQAMVFQRPVVLRRSVLANISYALAARGVGWRQRRRLSCAALEQVGLAALARRPARVLSGGEQQRLALARAWALQPQVLFLDEPTASLDPGATARIETIIESIFRQGTTIVMTTHDLGQARRHADRVVFLNRGRVCESAAADTFFAGPASEPARRFVAGELLS